MKPRLTERSERKSLAECDPIPSEEMYYVYVLHNPVTGGLYYGYTHAMHTRGAAHRRTGTWELVYYEAYRAEGDARRREYQLKHHAQALTALKGRAAASLKALGVGFNSRSDLRSLSLRKSRAH